MAMTPIELVHSHVQQCRDQVENLGEPWLRDHIEAEEAAVIDSVLKYAAWVAEFIFERDESLRLASLTGGRPYADADRALIAQCLALWLAGTAKAVPILEKYERKGHAVASSAHFKKMRVEIRGALEDPKKFFSGHALEVLEEQAAREYQQGKTEPLLGE